MRSVGGVVFLWGLLLAAPCLAQVSGQQGIPQRQVIGASWMPTQQLVAEPTEPWGAANAPALAPGQDEVKQALSPAAIAQLMRPTVGFDLEWQQQTRGVEIVSYDARVSVPTYPIFGPPPPLIDASFSFTDVSSPVGADLPSELYDYALGFSWLRPVHERWTLRFTASAALATDTKNNSSDAWQFRGGAFAMYRPNTRWTWLFGVLALGRNDIPVVPAVGAIYQPHPGMRFDLTFPRPRAAMLLVDRGPRQQWGYIGMGLGGGTWAYERTSGLDDQITLRDWRAVIGWESIPTPAPGMPFTRGHKLGFEVGYLFGRDFEFESDDTSISLGNTMMARLTARW